MTSPGGDKRRPPPPPYITRPFARVHYSPPPPSLYNNIVARYNLFSVRHNNDTPFVVRLGVHFGVCEPRACYYNRPSKSVNLYACVCPCVSISVFIFFHFNRTTERFRLGFYIYSYSSRSFRGFTRPI